MIELSELYKKQSQLDMTIASKRGIGVEETLEERCLAFLVELGELANETRCFKYWSSKGMSPKERILDEYADGLHFLLSIGNIIKTSFLRGEGQESYQTLTDAFVATYNSFTIFVANPFDKLYIRAFQEFLTLGKMLSLSEEEIEEAYLKKLKINYERQENGY